MPQLDFSVFPSQLFWLCVTFFTMLFVMSKFIILTVPPQDTILNYHKVFLQLCLHKQFHLSGHFREEYILQVNLLLPFRILPYFH